MAPGNQPYGTLVSELYSLQISSMMSSTPFSHGSTHDELDMPDQWEQISTLGEATKAPEASQRQILQLKHFGSSPRNKRHRILPSNGQVSVAQFACMQYPGLPDFFGSLLAYIGSQTKKDRATAYGRRLYIIQHKEYPSLVNFGYTGQPIEKRRIQLLRKTPLWSIQSSTESDTYCVPEAVRLGQIIAQSLQPQRRVLVTSIGNRQMEHMECFQAEAAQMMTYVKRWVQWLKSNPYDKDGILQDRYVRQIRYFSSHQHKLQALAELSPLQLWSMFLDPSWWIRLCTSYYGQTLRQIPNVYYLLRFARYQVRSKYHKSSYGKARKSSRLRKSTRAEVENISPQNWNIQAVYGHH